MYRPSLFGKTTTDDDCFVSSETKSISNQQVFYYMITSNHRYHRLVMWLTNLPFNSEFMGLNPTPYVS